MLSAQALTGIESPACLRLPARVQDQAMLLLLDSGSSHSFVSSSLVDRLQLDTKPISPVPVKVANGQFIIYDRIVPQLAWVCQGHRLLTDLRVLDLDAYDSILGMDWLDAHSPMNCQWKEKSISFDHNGQWITLQGLTAASIPAPTPMDLSLLQQMEAHNEIWAMAVLEQLPDGSSDTTVPAEIRIILTEFSDVFAEPEGLPPRRQYDHAITLEADAKPPNSKPYRYSPMQKDEIERQVSDMLRSGVIEHSMSPYAAPVLLVKKKDDS
jgi:hypothetical protein